MDIYICNKQIIHNKKKYTIQDGGWKGAICTSITGGPNGVHNFTSVLIVKKKLTLCQFFVVDIIIIKQMSYSKMLVNNLHGIDTVHVFSVQWVHKF